MDGPGKQEWMAQLVLGTSPSQIHGALHIVRVRGQAQQSASESASEGAHSWQEHQAPQQQCARWHAPLLRPNKQLIRATSAHCPHRQNLFVLYTLQEDLTGTAGHWSYTYRNKEIYRKKDIRYQHHQKSRPLHMFSHTTEAGVHITRHTNVTSAILLKST